MRRAGFVTLVAALALVACSDDEGGFESPPEPSDTPTTAPTTTTPTTAPTTVPTTVPTTGPATTAARPATTPPTSTPTFEPLPPDARWTPACVEQPPTGAVATDDRSLESLAPLGAAPGLRIRLPLGSPGAAAAPAPPSAMIERVPGGLAVVVRPSSFEPFDASIVTVVEHDGSVRWRRCIDGIIAARLLAGGPWLLVETAGPAGGTRWLGFDPLTGADAVPPPAIVGLTPTAEDDGHVLLRRFDERPLARDDMLALFDRATGAVTVLPYPAAVEGAVPGTVDLGLSGGDIVHRDATGVPVAVYDGAAWLTDVDSLVAMVEPEAVYDYAGGGWMGRDGAGRVLWRQPGWLDVFGEGFRSTATDGVTLLIACRDGVMDESGSCVDSLFLGVDTRTGQVLWERPGRHAAPVAGDGVAIVTTDDGTFTMIDVHTGRPVDDAPGWPLGSFMQGCCGEDEFLWTRRSGGVVLAANYQDVAVWYPAEFTSETVTVELLG